MTRSDMVEGHVRVNRTSKASRYRACPSTMLRMVTLPVPGRIG
jgi:hypothetical protein